MNKFLVAVSMLAILGACGEPTRDVAQIEQSAQRDTQERLVQSTPLPALQYSAERVNLVRRAERLNTQNFNGCVTLLSYGRVVAQYNVAGKVSSLNAYLTGAERWARVGSYGGSSYFEMVESPDVDGAYGTNADGVFFFEANTDAYVEWGGNGATYMFSDQCLTPNERPLVTRAG